MKRVDFANTLRGLAAICVVISHYYGIFWTNLGPIATMINGPILSTKTHTLPAYLSWIHSFTLFRWDGFGVALFFLISGFVIPFSLKRLTWSGFFINRFFRLVPTYVVGFSITLIAIWVSTRYFSTQWPYSLHEIIIHYVPGLRDILMSRNIDGIIWTLEIEIKFYMLCLLSIVWFRQESLNVFLIPLFLFLSASMLVYLPTNLINTTPMLEKMVAYYRLFVPYLIFMFIGVSFHYLYVAKISAEKTMLLIGGLFALFCILWHTGPFKEGFYMAWSYGFALLTFMFAYTHQAFFRANRAVDFFANISYPLYASHEVAGFVGLRIFLHAGIPIWISLLIVTVSAICIAWLIHMIIEKPSLKLVKYLTRKKFSSEQKLSLIGLSNVEIN